MKSISKSFIFSLFLGLLVTISASAQNRSFSDPNVDYTFELPDERWKLVSKPSATSPNVNYVFVTAKDGDLEVRKITASDDKPTPDIIRDEEDKLQFLPGYVAGKDENFSGFLKGAIFNFEFVRSGRNMAGRFYFLRSGDTVYILRFTAYKDNLRSLRNQTDSIARTFSVKKS